MIMFLMVYAFNTLNAKLNSICHMLALLGALHILHVSRIRVNITFQSTWCYLLRISDHFSFNLLFIVLHIHIKNIGLYTYLKITLSTRFWDVVKKTLIAVSNSYQSMDLCFIFIYSVRLFFHWTDPSPKDL
jgi:hypothetical protein